MNETLFGPGVTLFQFLSNYGFALIGIVLNVLIKTVKRNPGSNRTPFKFNFDFLTYDNATRFILNFVLNLLLIFVSLRFVNQLLGLQLSEWISFGIGFGIDNILYRLKKFNIIDKNKDIETFVEQRKEKGKEVAEVI